MTDGVTATARAGNESASRTSNYVEKSSLLVSHIKKELSQAETALEFANEVQWDRRRSSSDTDDGDAGTIRSLNVHTDPTGDIACDGDRLSVRSAMTRAEKLLMVAYQAVREARTNLERSTATWLED